MSQSTTRPRPLNEPFLPEPERRQNTFNAVWQHSAQMTGRSMDADRRGCMYRAPDGNRCFVGALIPDAAYDPAMDNLENFPDSTIDNVLDEYDGLAESLTGAGYTTEPYFLQELQGIHDRYFTERKGLLIAFARSHILTIPA